MGDEPTLIFDGDCGFCTRCALWLMEHKTREMTVVPYQQADLEAFGVTEEQAQRAAWWIDGKLRERGHRAIGHALRACRSPWPLFGRLLLIPPISWLAAVGYELVARNRGRFPGTTPACRRPGGWPPE